MRVGIDARPALYGRSGIGTYVRELLTALATTFPDDRFEAYGHRLRGRGTRGAWLPPPGPPNLVVHDAPLPATAVRLGALLGFGMERVLGGVDVLHATDYVRLPLGRVPLVATIHDVLFASLPECYTPVMRTNLEATTCWLLGRAREVIVPSARVRDDLLARYGADPSHVHVVPHGVPHLPPAPAVQDLGRYVLALGTLEPRKNLVRLLEALDRVRTTGHDVGAVVVGARGWLDEPIVDALRARPWVRHEPSADRARIAGLLHGAALLAYPSLGEGFGLPVLEGFAAGLPVLVGAGTASSDLAGEAALAVDPTDVDALAIGLSTLLDDAGLRARLVEAGRRVAAEHTWERTAIATRGVYARARTT